MRLSETVLPSDVDEAIRLMKVLRTEFHGLSHKIPLPFFPSSLPLSHSFFLSHLSHPFLSHLFSILILNLTTSPLSFLSSNFLLLFPFLPFSFPCPTPTFCFTPQLISSSSAFPLSPTPLTSSSSPFPSLFFSRYPPSQQPPTQEPGK